MNNISFQPFVIGVAGGSGSGKSTVSQQVLASFGADMVSVVMQDDYYRDQSDLTPDVRRKQNYDHPHAFDWPLLVQHVQALRAGETIAMPEYDFTIDNRSDRTIAVRPAPVIVIEGLFALYDENLRDMMSLKIFVDTASDVRFIRRMQRDIVERGRSVDSIVGQYLETVRPMHKQFIEPTKRRHYFAAWRERPRRRHDHHQGGQRDRPAETVLTPRRWPYTGSFMMSST
jgi:uridine kinase